MAGVAIYQLHKELCLYQSITIPDDRIYKEIIENFPQHSKILWSRENVTLEQIDEAQDTKNSLVERLNQGQEVNLEEELAPFFE